MTRASKVLNEGNVPRATLILELLSASTWIDEDGTATAAPPEHTAETPEEREARHKKERDEQDAKDFEHDRRMKEIEAETGAAIQKNHGHWWQGKSY